MSAFAESPSIIRSGTQLVANPTSLSLGYEFDAAGNLIALRDGNQGEPALRTYGYDGVDRLTAVRNGGTGQLLQGYAYDATGNRQSRTDGSATTAYAYPGSSHRLSAVGAQSRGYDAVGNTLSIGGGASGGPGACLLEFGCETPPPPPQPDPPGFDPPPGDPSYTSQSQGGTASSTGTGATAPALREFVYNAANRMSEVRHDGATAMQYRYNGLGEQVLKFNASRRTVTVYDESGRWIGDYDSATGNPIQQVIWLHDLPVGLLVGSGASQTLYYIEPDMLGTPRVVLNPTTGQAVWRWDLTDEAFGDTEPSQDPDGDGQAFVFDMRFPGQRFDAATGLNYNYFREYDPASGRYSQSDPIGLSGGISTFGYAGMTPMNAIDRDGLVWGLAFRLATRAFARNAGRAALAAARNRQAAALTGATAVGVAYYTGRLSRDLSAAVSSSHSGDDDSAEPEICPLLSVASLPPDGPNDDDEDEDLVYKGTRKHEKNSWGTEMDLDASTAQKVLNR